MNGSTSFIYSYVDAHSKGEGEEITSIRELRRLCKELFLIRVNSTHLAFLVPSFYIMALLCNVIGLLLLARSAIAATTWASYTVSATTKTISSTTLKATATDESVILIENEGVAYLTDVTIIKTGDASDDTLPSGTDLNAAVGLQYDGTVYMTDCNITTNGIGANALHLYEDGNNAYLYNLYVHATGNYAHGVYAAGG